MDKLAEEQIFKSVTSSKKYKNVDPGVVNSLIHEGEKRFKKSADIEKYVKTKLHQVYAAYSGSINYQKINELISEISPLNISEKIILLLMMHSSTSERLPYYDAVRDNILRLTGTPFNRVHDLACGLNPFAFPLLFPDGKTIYTGTDIDSNLTGAFESFFVKTGFPGSYLCSSITGGGPVFSSQYIFLLKTLPCLEQQKKGVTGEILDRLDFEYLVVSFPTRSLTGKKKGMNEFYGAAFRKVMDSRGWKYSSFEIPNELFFVVEGGKGAD